MELTMMVALWIFIIDQGNLFEHITPVILNFDEKDFIIAQGIFNYAFIEKLVEHHIHQRADNTFQVRAFYCFQKWFTFNHE